MRTIDTVSLDPRPTVGLGTWELAVDRGVVTYSPGFAAMLGLAPGNTITLAEWEDLVVPDDRPAFRAALETFLLTASGASEHRTMSADRRVRVVLLRCDASALNVSDEQCVRGAIVDITDLREAERRQRAATSMFEQGFDAAPIGMSLSDPQDGRYLRINDALCAMLGRSRAELMGLSVNDITHPDDRELNAAAMRALVHEGAAEYHMEKRYLRVDGSIVWAAVHLAAVKDADGRIEALYAQKIDISERKEREKAQRSLVHDAEWLPRIRDALDEDRLTLYWQPIVDLRSGEMVQRELLLRMTEDTGEVIAPGEFLPVAERYGLMPEIDRWVIRQATRLAAESGPMEFNLSAASVGDPMVLAELADAIETTGVTPAHLVIEVTETAMIDQPEAGRRFAKRVRDLGCGLALDDFGTGFSSLRYLKELPADHLKIDIEFVRDLADNETDQRLVRGIVGLAAEFRQTTTAEGIEDQPTLTKLLQLGVDRGQGYLFGRPAPVKHPMHTLPLKLAAGNDPGGSGLMHAVDTSPSGPAANPPWPRRLLEHIREVVLILDEDGTIADSSPAAEERLGYAPGTLAGSAITAIAAPEDAAALTGAAQRCTSDRPITVHHQLRRRDRDLWAVESTVVRLQAEERAGVFIISREDGDRLEAESERDRRELNRRASHRLEAVGQLSAGIAHEINTPLQFVGDSVSFLRDAVDELVALIGRYREALYQETPVPLEKRRDVMRHAEEVADVEDLCERIPAAFDRTADGIERVRSIVMAMKRFSHASGAELAPADINDAIETTLTVCRNEYKYVAEIDLGLGELPPVLCEVDELNQVFLNLIINAAHAIEEKADGRGELGLIRIATWLDGEEAVIEVTDDGAGIPSGLRDRIFEPFFTTKEIGKGTGQGLALALATVQRHAGSIECVSTPGEGTTFRVRLPLRRAPVKAALVG